MINGKDVAESGVDLFLEITIMEMFNSDSLFDVGFFEASEDTDLAMNNNNPNFNRSVAMSTDYRSFVIEDEFGRNNSIRV